MKNLFPTLVCSGTLLCGSQPAGPRWANRARCRYGRKGTPQVGRPSHLIYSRLWPGHARHVQFAARV